MADAEGRDGGGGDDGDGGGARGRGDAGGELRTSTHDKRDKAQTEESEDERDRRREQLLEPQNLQRLLADALTYKSPLKDLGTIVRCGGDVNGPVSRGLRPLHYAVHANNLEGAAWLLEHGADVDAPDDIGYRPVHLCARKGLIEGIRLLMEHGAKFDFFTNPQSDGDAGSVAAMARDQRARDIGYLTIEPLNMALENGHLDIARLLLSRGARPDHRYFLGSEINLVDLNMPEALTLLLEHGADPNVFSRCGLSPLMKACRQHSVRAARILLDHGAQLELQPPPHFEQKTALHFAVLSGATGLTNLLLRKGARTRRPPGYRYAALHTAVVADKPEMCRLLLAWEASVDEQTDEGSTALQLACATPDLQRREELVSVLLTHGADANHAGAFVSYSSPYLSPLTEYLRCATTAADAAVVRHLLMHGAKVHFCTSSTSHRVRDAHGVLHATQYLRHKPGLFHLLLQAADKFEMDSISSYSNLTPPQRTVLQALGSGPRDLRTLSHLALVARWAGALEERVTKLPLPDKVKNFLLFLQPPAYLTSYT